MKYWRLVAAMSVAFGVLTWSVAAQAAVIGDVAVYSDTGDFVGQGTQHLVSTTTTALGGNAGDVTLGIGTSDGGSFSLEFAAPLGQTLQPGIYDNAGRAPFRVDGQPGIDITGNGHGCNTDFGRFEVKDIATDSSGHPNRLWVIYEQHCEGAQPALFGEVRIGEPAPAAPVSPLPAVVRWPANNFRTPETVVPVAFLASSQVDLTAATLAGDDPSDFTIRQDGCGGQRLPAGAACTVNVRFTPSAPGLRTATLVVHDTAGNAYAVPLQGWTYGGTTRLVMSSDAGDYIGQGQQYEFDPSNAMLEAGGTPESFSFSVNDGEWWDGEFAPSQGDIFAPNSTWTGAQRTAFRGSSAGVDVGGDGRGCNTVSAQLHVIDASYAADGTMKTFGVTFDQHCDGAQPALHGEFDWRLGDNTPPAPWMAASPAPGPTPPSPTPDPASSPSTAPAVPPAASSPAPTASVPAPSTATPSSVAAALGRTHRRLLADGTRSSKAVSVARRHPSNAADRRLAITTLTRLNRDVGSAKAALHSYRQVRVALGAWQSVLALELRSLRTARQAKTARMSKLDARARAAQTAALRAIAQLQNQLRPV
jgi:hypothetical protein